MQFFLDFWIFIFWLNITIFVVNSTNFINLLFFSESIWVIIFSIFVLLGIYIDDVNVIALSFFILSFAAIEFCIGYMLIILFKHYNKQINFIFKNNISKIMNNYVKSKVD